MDERHRRLVDAVKDLRDDATVARKESAEQVRSLEAVTITIAIGSVIAIVGGNAALNAAALSNMVASFYAGKNTPASIAQVTDQLKQVQDDVSRTQRRLKILLDSVESSGVTKKPLDSPPARLGRHVRAFSQTDFAHVGSEAQVCIASNS